MSDDPKLKFPELIPSENEDASGKYLHPLDLEKHVQEIHSNQSVPSLRRGSHEASSVPTRKEEPPKWLIYTLLIATTTICFGNYYVYDFPQALQTPFQDKLGIGPNDTNLLYSAYGLPNTVLTFFGGAFIG